ncbi:hypothetical protein [Nonomuraea sp. NPDC005692]|uniref:hypothetical protein n=1 Tax=Nonomuraea sp. NPDC005692 TaxID=3157168 RepID=UPI0033F923C3
MSSTPYTRPSEVLRADHDLRGAQFTQALSAGGAADGGDDTGSSTGGELYGEAADAAGRPGDQDAAARHRAEPTDRLQRRDPGDRQCARLPQVDGLGNDGQLGGVHGAQLRPGPRPAKSDHAGTDGRT